MLDILVPEIIGALTTEGVKAFCKVNVSKFSNYFKKEKKGEKDLSQKNTYSVLNEIKFEDNERLLEMWAKLLASTTSRGHRINFISIMGSLSPDEAMEFDGFCDSFFNKKDKHLMHEMVLDSLVSKGLISVKDTQGFESGEEPNSAAFVTKRAHLPSALGKEFYLCVNNLKK